MSTRIVLPALAAVLLLSGCAHLPGDLGAEQSGTFVAENTAGGAGAGAVIGCIVGLPLGAVIAVVTHNPDGLALGCLGGAALGASIGGVDGYQKGTEAKQQAEQVLAARQATTDIKEINALLSTKVEQAKVTVAQSQQQMVDLRLKLARKSITLEQAQQEAAAVRLNSIQIEGIIAEARKHRDMYVSTAFHVSGSDGQELNNQITVLNAEIDTLQHQLDQLDQLMKLVPLN